MKNSVFGSIGRGLPLFAGLLVMMPAVAMASSPEWRPKYDLIMMYVNFIILAAVIFKYAREPIKSFLKQQKEDVVSEMSQLETEKARFLDEIEAAKNRAAEGDLRFNEMKARLISQGEAKKQQMVDQAKQQSATMLEEARKKMETRILQAKSQLKMELADMAFEQASQQLPKIITDEDNQRLLEIYMKGMVAEQ
jgi:F-type H+-transporting ATPase subunit b